MAILASFLFAMVFALLSSKVRGWFTGVFASDGEFLNKYAPYSYILLALILIVPIFCVLAFLQSSKPVEPENPLARYKLDDVVED